MFLGLSREGEGVTGNHNEQRTTAGGHSEETEGVVSTGSQRPAAEGSHGRVLVGADLTAGPAADSKGQQS